jgi:hypothetical protein
MINRLGFPVNHYHGKGFCVGQYVFVATKTLQYYCSRIDEKMGYFGVKNGNKK